MSRDPVYKPPGCRIVTVPMEPALHKRLRIHAIEEGRTVKWIVTKLIERHLAKEDWLKSNGAVRDEEPRS